MNQFRVLGAQWWRPLLGVYFVLIGIALLFGVDVPTWAMGLLAILTGLFALFSS